MSILCLHPKSVKQVHALVAAAVSLAFKLQQTNRVASCKCVVFVFTLHDTAIRCNAIATTATTTTTSGRQCRSEAVPTLVVALLASFHFVPLGQNQCSSLMLHPSSLSPSLSLSLISTSISTPPSPPTRCRLSLKRAHCPTSSIVRHKQLDVNLRLFRAQFGRSLLRHRPVGALRLRL